MTDHDLTEDRIREIAQTEAQQTAQAVIEETVEDDEGAEWSIRKFVDQFGLSRRQAMAAMGLLLAGAVPSAAQAALRAISQPAEAATQDLTVPGDLSVGGAVSTEGVDITNLSAGVTKELSHYEQASNASGSDYVQFTSGVGTSPTPIYDTGVNSELGALALVFGREQDNINDFTDLVIYTAAGGSTVVGSTTRGSPATRSYSLDVRKLELAMGSSTYNVAARGVGIKFY